jgi:hypothetical protein
MIIMANSDDQVEVEGLSVGAVVVLAVMVVIGILIGMGCSSVLGGC